MSLCPSNDALTRCAAGVADPAERQLVMEHAGQCTECAAVLGMALGEPGGGLRAGDAVGRFVIVDRLGAGAMSEVFLAWDPFLRRRVALKVLRSELTDGVPLLIAEARSLAAVDHPNVLAVHDVGFHRGRPYLALEFVEGETLGEWCRRTRPHWRAVLDALIHAAEGLIAVHHAGFVHGDFKPGNVLRSSCGRIRIADFGLTRLAGVSTVGVTPRFAAPEVEQRQLAAAVSDQYSFCATLWACTAESRGPLGLDEWLRLERAPAALRPILRRGLSPSPSDRYPGMEALLADLRSVARAPRRRVMVAVLSVLGLVAAGTGTLIASEDACLAEARTRATAWTGVDRQAVLARVAQHPLASAQLQYLVGRLDTWRDAWIAQARLACEGSRAGRPMPPLERFNACLEHQRRVGAAVVVAVLSQSDEALASAADLTSLLPSPETCGAEDAVPPAEVAALTADQYLLVERAVQQGDAASEKAVLEAWESLSRESTEVAAEFALGAGRILSRRWQTDDARRALHAAADIAERKARDDLRAGAEAELAVLEGSQAGRSDLAATHQRRADAILARAGDSLKLIAAVEQRLGWYELHQRQHTQALRRLGRAVEASLLLYGARDLRTLDAMRSLAHAHKQANDLDRALVLARRAMVALEEMGGKSDPRVMRARCAVAAIHLSRREPQAALLELGELPWPDAVSELLAARATWALGMVDETRAHLERSAMLATSEDVGHRVQLNVQWANVRAAAGDVELALALLSDAARHQTRLTGEHSAAVGEIALARARIEAQASRHRAALATLEAIDPATLSPAVAAECVLRRADSLVELGETGAAASVLRAGPAAGEDDERGLLWRTWLEARVTRSPGDRQRLLDVLHRMGPARDRATQQQRDRIVAWLDRP